MLTRQRLDARFIQGRHKLLQNEEEIALEQSPRDGGGDGREDAKSGRVGDGLVTALLLLLCLPSNLIPSAGLLGMMYRAGHVGAYLVDSTNITAFGNDGVGRVLTLLELGTLRLVVGLGPVISYAVYVFRGRTGLPSC
jgi:hypothetical protein